MEYKSGSMFKFQAPTEWVFAFLISALKHGSSKYPYHFLDNDVSQALRALSVFQVGLIQIKKLQLSYLPRPPPPLTLLRKYGLVYELIAFKNTKPDKM